jgi:hypothetical protein
VLDQIDDGTNYDIVSASYLALHGQESLDSLRLIITTIKEKEQTLVQLYNLLQSDKDL